jgi:hypothetical protein
MTQGYTWFGVHEQTDTGGYSTGSSRVCEEMLCTPTCGTPAHALPPPTCPPDLT